MSAKVIDWYEWQARSFGFASFVDLEAAHDAAMDAEMEKMARARGFASFSEFYEAESR